MYKAKVYVSLKKTVADPQGKTVKTALEHLNYSGIEDLRMGKLVEMELKAGSRAEAEEKVKSMSGKLLVNPIIEDYTFDIEEMR